MNIFGWSFEAFEDFKNKQQKKVCEVLFFWYVKVCIFWKFIQYSIQWDKSQMLKSFFFRQNKR